MEPLTLMNVDYLPQTSCYLLLPLPPPPTNSLQQNPLRLKFSILNRNPSPLRNHPGVGFQLLRPQPGRVYPQVHFIRATPPQYHLSMRKSQNFLTSLRLERHRPQLCRVAMARATSGYHPSIHRRVDLPSVFHFLEDQRYHLIKPSQLYERVIHAVVTPRTISQSLVRV